jgi:ribosomal protein S18 acetylase RimI-like enzyme
VITVETGGPDDFHEVLAFWKDATTVPSSTDDVISLSALVERTPNALIVVRVDGGVVGTVIAAWDGWRAAMYRLAVAPNQRRQGIATALVQEGEARLRAHGARRFHLIVQDGEDPAREFWQAMGYEATTQLRFVKTLS